MTPDQETMTTTAGPNVRKLIVHKMALLMIPPGTPNAFQAGITALSTPGSIAAKAKEAAAWVEQAIAVVKTAPDNPYHDDEAIAAEILQRVAERQTTRPGPPSVGKPV